MSLPFPLAWSWTISVASPEGSVPNSIHGATVIEQALFAEKATSVIRTESTIEFECKGIGGMSRNALLAPISGGKIDVQFAGDSLRITYTLEFLLAFWFSILITILFWFFDFHRPVSFDTFIPFCWLYGGNVVLSLWRFQAFLRRNLRTPNPAFKRDAEKRGAP